MRPNAFTVALASAGVLGAAAVAEVPTEWDLAVAARSSETAGFNLPIGAMFRGVALAPDGGIALSFIVDDPDAPHGLWLGDADGGSVVWTPDGAISLSAPAISNDAVVVTVATPASAVLARVDRGSGEITALIDADTAGLDPSALAMTDPSLAANGIAGIRAQGLDGTIAWVAVDDAGAIDLAMATDDVVDLDAAVGSAALGGLGGRVDLVGGGQQIRRYDVPDFFVLLAEDVDSRLGAPLVSIDSRVDFDRTGRAAFVATRLDGVRAVRLANGTLDIDVADSAKTLIGSIDNGDGVRPGVAPSSRRVVFTGTDGEGVAAAFVADGSGVAVIARVGDPVTADVKGAFIGGFGSVIDIDDADRVVVAVQLVDADGQSLGEGLLTARPTPEPPGLIGDLDMDGDVDFTDLLTVLSVWGTDDAVGDVDESGLVDFGDVLLLLSVWTG